MLKSQRVFRLFLVPRLSPRVDTACACGSCSLTADVWRFPQTVSGSSAWCRNCRGERRTPELEGSAPHDCPFLNPQSPGGPGHRQFSPQTPPLGPVAHWATHGSLGGAAPLLQFGCKGCRSRRATRKRCLSQACGSECWGRCRPSTSPGPPQPRARRGPPAGPQQMEPKTLPATPASSRARRARRPRGERPDGRCGAGTCVAVGTLATGACSGGDRGVGGARAGRGRGRGVGEGPVCRRRGRRSRTHDFWCCGWRGRPPHLPRDGPGRRELELCPVR